MKMNNPTGYLTTKELAQVLGDITVQGVYKALKTHHIDVIATPSRRKKIPSLGVRKLLIERGREKSWRGYQRQYWHLLILKKKSRLKGEELLQGLRMIQVITPLKKRISRK